MVTKKTALIFISIVIFAMQFGNALCPAKAAQNRSAGRVLQVKNAEDNVFFTVQVFACVQQEKARSFANQLTAKEYPAYINEVLDDKGKKIYRVRIGKFTTRREAELQAQLFHEKEKMPFWISRVSKGDGVHAAAIRKVPAEKQDQTLSKQQAPSRPYQNSFDDRKTAPPQERNAQASGVSVFEKKKEELNPLTPAPNYHLKDLERLVLAENSAIKAARQRIRALALQLNETKASLGPEITSQYSYYPESDGLGDEEIDTEHRFYIRLRQDLIKLLKIKPGIEIEMAMEMEGAQAELEETERGILFELRKEYFEILKEKMQTDLYNKLQEIHQSLLGLFKKRHQLQEGLLADVLKAEKDFIEARDAFLYHKDNVTRRIDLLAESLKIKSGEIKIEDFNGNVSLPAEEQLIATALKNRGEIKLLETKARREKQKAETAPYKDFKLSPYLGYRMREDRQTGSESGPEIGLLFTMPLRFKEVNKNRSSRLKAQEYYWESEAQRVADDIKRAIRRAYEKYSLEQYRLITIEKEIALIKEEARVEQAKLDKPIKGITADPANLLAIEANLTRLLIKRLNAKLEKAKGYYELVYLAGFAQPEDLLVYHAKAIGGKNTVHPKALWVWNVKDFLGDEQAEAALISFCKTKGIKSLFFSLNRQIVDTLPQNTVIQQFITKLHQEGITISALFGENLWIYSRNRKNLLAHIQSVIRYNSLNDEYARFDGIHLDIEPYVLKEWDQDKRKLLTLLLKTYQQVKETMLQGGSTLKLEVDIPAHYDKVDPALLQEIFEVADTVTVMAYKKTEPEQIIASVKEELQAAMEANKAMLVGLNTKDFMNEVKLQELIDAAGAELSENPCFSGWSIHDFQNYLILAGK